ncbi:glutaredoxin-3-like [Limulus polyphemus]|uniref:Glutaredoxin-3-like n=1 Tax=Limulus polyphemus TaxID=6850 RepID=A0ABM1BQD8_LIMPO|nr:glutaredoxin-3-like [Limulus polyphemus]
MAGSVREVKTKDEFWKIVTDVNKNHLNVVHFWAEWASQCQMMDDVVKELTSERQLKEVKFLKVEAEALPDISQHYSVTSVPTFLLLKGNTVVDKVEGADAPTLTKKVHQQATKMIVQPPAEPSPSIEDLNSRLKKLVNTATCMLFMKGTPEEPCCGFSKKTVELLQKYNTQFSSFNILADQEVREGLKKFSNWPTYPQLYINGELVGGLDILKELDETGELEPMLPKKEDLNKRLGNLINKAPLMIFMKGSRDNPRCGFSKTLIGILNETGRKYETFDILQDEEVRQGLKTFSNWPTYPQIYVNGSLIGGLDIIKELQETGELDKTLNGE